MIDDRHRPIVDLLRTKKVIEDLAKNLDHDQRLGAEIVLRAVEAPAKQIAANAGQNCAVIVAEILSNKSASYGGLYSPGLDFGLDHNLVRSILDQHVQAASAPL